MLRVSSKQASEIGVLANDCRSVVAVNFHCAMRGQTEITFDEARWLAGLRNILGVEIVDALIADGQTTSVNIVVDRYLDMTEEERQQCASDRAEQVAAYLKTCALYSTSMPP
jgi:hypothetical protein